MKTKRLMIGLAVVIIASSMASAAFAIGGALDPNGAQFAAMGPNGSTANLLAAFQTGGDVGVRIDPDGAR